MSDFQNLTFFISGIIQGSLKGKEIHTQDYRGEIKRIIGLSFPQAQVICPVEIYPDSANYSYEQGRETFFNLFKMVRQADILIAYLPEASMGTALEMWQAYKAGKPIISVSPLASNWVIKFLSNYIFSSIEDFKEASHDGELQRIIENLLSQKVSE